MGSHITQHLIKLSWICKGFPDRSMTGKGVNLTGRRDALKSRWCCYMWQLLFCPDIKYHGCLGTIRMNSCQINISTTFLWCFQPPWICHGRIHLEQAAFSQAFIRNTSWPGWFGPSAALRPSLWQEHKPGRANSFRNGEAQATPKQLSP